MVIEEPEDRRDHDMKIIKSHAIQLTEHFDSVQIFVTRMTEDQDNIIGASTGEGNWYARFGQVVEWVEQQNERARVNIREDD